MSCCNKIYKFNSPVNGCNAASFSALFAGLADGDYTVQLDFLGSVQSFTITVASGVVTLTTGVVLNENYTYTGRVVGVPLVMGGVSYDCFMFQTVGFGGNLTIAPAPTQQLNTDDVSESDDRVYLTPDEKAFLQQLKADYQS